MSTSAASSSSVTEGSAVLRLRLADDGLADGDLADGDLAEGDLAEGSFRGGGFIEGGFIEGGLGGSCAGAAKTGAGGTGAEAGAPCATGGASASVGAKGARSAMGATANGAFPSAARQSKDRISVEMGARVRERASGATLNRAGGAAWTRTKLRAQSGERNPTPGGVHVLDADGTHAAGASKPWRTLVLCVIWALALLALQLAPHRVPPAAGRARLPNRQAETSPKPHAHGVGNDGGKGGRAKTAANCRCANAVERAPVLDRVIRPAREVLDDL
eukprot:1899520-Pleurochrysis_carterae.AAC.1